MDLPGPLILVSASALILFSRISDVSQASNENEIEADYISNYDYEFDGGSEFRGLLFFKLLLFIQIILQLKISDFTILFLMKFYDCKNSRL